MEHTNATQFVVHTLWYINFDLRNQFANSSTFWSATSFEDWRPSTVEENDFPPLPFSKIKYPSHRPNQLTLQGAVMRVLKSKRKQTKKRFTNVEWKSSKSVVVKKHYGFIVSKRLLGSPYFHLCIHAIIRLPKLLIFRLRFRLISGWRGNNSTFQSHLTTT